MRATRFASLLVLLVLSSIVAGNRSVVQGQTKLPNGWREIVWEGVVIRYPPNKYVFSVKKPRRPSSRAAALLLQSPNPCTPTSVDCVPREGWFEIFPSNGLDVRGWIERYQAEVYPDMLNGFTDIWFDGRQAAVIKPPQELFTPKTFIIPMGDDMLVVTDRFISEITQKLRTQQPAVNRLRVGATAVTKLDTTWKLWTSASGSERVNERPLIRPGSFVTILAIQRNAVQVRTSDLVTGWIRASVNQALVPSVDSYPQQWLEQRSAHVVLKSGVPFRQAPNSKAGTIISNLPAGTRLGVFGSRGDWLYVMHDYSRMGWVRWSYDNLTYVAPDTK